MAGLEHVEYVALTLGIPGNLCFMSPIVKLLRERYPCASIFSGLDIHGIDMTKTIDQSKAAESVIDWAKKAFLIEGVKAYYWSPNLVEGDVDETLALVRGNMLNGLLTLVDHNNQVKTLETLAATPPAASYKFYPTVYPSLTREDVKQIARDFMPYLNNRIARKR
jgi:hypothetical protein